MASTVSLVAIVVLWCVLVLALVAATKMMPPNRYERISVESHSPLVFPETCVITGEPATERRWVRLYSLIYPMAMSCRAVSLPFSSSGWAEYRKQFPLSLTIFKTGLNILRRIPFFGAFLALYVWAPFGGPVCGVFAVRDLWHRRCQLVSFDKVGEKSGELREVNMRVVSRAFVEEFIKVNPSAGYRMQEIQPRWEHGTDRGEQAK
jgi:hypothetical protein